MMKTKQSASKVTVKKRALPRGFVAFNFKDGVYHIDVERRKVYQSWVEVEKSKQFQIISAYRATQAAIV